MKYLPLNPNRPWPIHSKQWIMRQDWLDAYFLNAVIDKSILQKLLPVGLDLDLFEGEAYISVIPFKMDKVCFRYLPFFKIKSFNQVNIRTYVIRDGKPGVFFLSLNSTHAGLKQIINSVCDIPIFSTSISRIDTDLKTQVDAGRENLSLYLNLSRTDKRIVPKLNSFEYWICERYCFYNLHQGRMTRWDVDHIEWPIYAAKIHNLSFEESSNLAGLGLSKLDFSSCYYSPGVSTRAWGPRIE